MAPRAHAVVAVSLLASLAFGVAPGCRGRSGAAHEIPSAGVAAGWRAAVAAPTDLARRALRFAAVAGGDDHEVAAGAESAVWREGDRVAGAYVLAADVLVEDGMLGLVVGAGDLAGLADRRPVAAADAASQGLSLRALERARADRLADDRWMVFAVRPGGTHRIWAIEGAEERERRPAPAVAPTALDAASQEHASVRLEVEVGPLATVFRIGGVEVARAPRGALPTDGAFGWWFAPGTRGVVGPFSLRRGLR